MIDIKTSERERERREKREIINSYERSSGLVLETDSFDGRKL